MVVIDYFFSTAFAECIVTDTPVIVFEENEYPSLTENARPIYDALFSAGVVHTTLESAVSFVNKSFDDIAEWWNKPEVKNAVRDYVTTFGSTTNQPTLQIDENT